MENTKLIHKVYLAGPIEDRDKEGIFGWRDKASKLLAEYEISTFVPGENTIIIDPHTINVLDFLMINNSEAILVNLSFLEEGEHSTLASGTLVELGYARAKGKLIVGFSDISKWGKPHLFLRGILDKHFSSLEFAVRYLGGFNKRRRI